jgi:coproporphyrinogen III oxidase-like Fe-S oxidoreductase
LGVGAHSLKRFPSPESLVGNPSYENENDWRLGSRRWGNVRQIANYLEAVQRQEWPVAEQEELTFSERVFEYLMLRLRMRCGMDRQAATMLLSVAPKGYKNLLQRYVGSGHMIDDVQGVRFSNTGMLVSNEILSEFFLTHSQGDC